MFSGLFTSHRRSFGRPQPQRQREQGSKVVFTQIRTADGTALVTDAVTGMTFPFAPENGFTGFGIDSLYHCCCHSTARDIGHHLSHIDEGTKNCRYEQYYRENSFHSSVGDIAGET